MLVAVVAVVVAFVVAVVTVVTVVAVGVAAVTATAAVQLIVWQAHLPSYLSASSSLFAGAVSAYFHPHPLVLHQVH